MPNYSENDVNTENINEALSVTIPELFAETVSTYDLEYRYQRHERLREKCAKKFAKYGISDLFDSADFTGASIVYADNYDEKKLLKYIMFLLLLNVFDDYLARGFCNIKLESCDNNNQQQQQQSIEAIKPSIWSLTKLGTVTVLPMLIQKQSVFQIWLIIRSGILFLKEHFAGKLFRRNKTFDSYQKYVKHRRNDFATEIILVGTQNACKVSFDIKTNKHELMRSLHEIYLDLHWQSNDLYSFKKEFLNGEHAMNAITVLKNENNVS